MMPPARIRLRRRAEDATCTRHVSCSQTETIFVLYYCYCVHNWCGVLLVVIFWSLKRYTQRREGDSGCARVAFNEGMLLVTAQ